MVKQLIMLLTKLSKLQNYFISVFYSVPETKSVTFFRFCFSNFGNKTLTNLVQHENGNFNVK